MTVFETETIAELCVKQGLVAEGLAILRRLVTEAPDDATRARRAARVRALEGAAAASAEPAPPSGSTLRLERRGDVLTFAWTLPAGTSAPTLQLLLVKQGPGGIETEARTVALGASAGTTTVRAPGLHSVHAAVGWLDGARFVPLMRLPL